MKIFIGLVFCIAGLFGPVVLAAPSFFAAPVVVTATVTSTKVMNQNNLRTYLIIMNQGATNNVIVKFGSVQSASEGVIIPPGGSYEPLEAPASTVYLRSAASTSAVTIIEGN